VSGPRSSVPFELALRIEAADIDEMGHVNNTVYVRWIQDVAAAHWRAAAPVEAQARVAWVVLRHEIDYQTAAVPGDVLVARTWVGAAAGLTFERHTEIVRTSDGRLLARARTLWCPVDSRTGRPRRVTPELRAQFSVSSGDEAGGATT
jgi:acyl-CoA thioester hydrolase